MIIVTYSFIVQENKRKIREKEKLNQRKQIKEKLNQNKI